MDFTIDSRPKPNVDKYSQEVMDVAYKFAEKAMKEFGSFLKAVVLFGSAARKASPEGDIDILLIVDDTAITVRPEIAQTYRIIVQKLIRDISPRLHVTTLKFTNFWDYMRVGDPVAINILRDGVALIDTGFFDPLQLLLKQGRIRPTSESVWNYFVRAPATMQNSRWHITQATLDLYWAVIDAAHAALMRIGEVPPTPSHAHVMLEDSLVRRKLLEPKYPAIMKKFFDLMKDITHRKIKYISGTEYDRLAKDAQDFIDRMKVIVEDRKLDALYRRKVKSHVMD